ncbi:hypothetical protein PN441_06815 [Spirulina major CS-329]|uniref:hypothetical protein n=1 Tax=Spirulina TaxID=1154 RepID=UPI00232D160B|nr:MULTISPECIES: hypothetical protein [Spirulina]MDB9496342.1 hypothetical protein [Spirulina subsalsa CS-330]MDB9502778.1 hypothetical protein [Spirulina major CS-329]
MHDRLGEDGLTTWHPAYLALGETLEQCAAEYRKFCKRYKLKAKPPKRNHWGKNLLQGFQNKRKAKKPSPGQTSLPWDQREVMNPAVIAVAEKFILANCYNPKVAGAMLRKSCSTEFVESGFQELENSSARYRKARPRMGS